MNCTAKTWRTPTPQPELFSLFEEEPGGGRPGSVTDPAPQERVVRHIVEHSVEPQGGNQLVEAFWHLDLHVPEQDIEVPKIPFSPRRSRRRRVCLVQMAEQLVEVPEFVQLAALLQQELAAPGGPQGLLPGRDYLFVWDQNRTFQFLTVVADGRSGRSSRTEVSSVLWNTTC